jgi:hypothetical protein
MSSAARLETACPDDSFARTFSERSNKSCRVCADSDRSASIVVESEDLEGSPGPRIKSSSSSCAQELEVKWTPSEDSSTEKSGQTTRFSEAARKAFLNSAQSFGNSAGNQAGDSRESGGITNT